MSLRGRKTTGDYLALREGLKTLSRDDLELYAAAVHGAAAQLNVDAGSLYEDIDTVPISFYLPPNDAEGIGRICRLVNDRKYEESVV